MLIDTLHGSAEGLLLLEITGERVVLIPISRKFADVIFKEFTAEVTRYLVRRPPENIAQIDEYIEECRRKMIEGKELTFVVLLREEREFLGVCAVHGQDLPVCSELGIWIKKNAQGKGFGRDAIRTLAAWIAKNLELGYLLYPVDRNNIPSRRLAESMGGVIYKEGKRESMSGALLDEVVYRIDVEKISLEGALL